MFFWNTSPWEYKFCKYLQNIVDIYIYENDLIFYGLKSLNLVFTISILYLDLLFRLFSLRIFLPSSNQLIQKQLQSLLCLKTYLERTFFFQLFVLHYFWFHGLLLYRNVLLIIIGNNIVISFRYLHHFSLYHWIKKVINVYYYLQD